MRCTPFSEIKGNFYFSQIFIPLPIIVWKNVLVNKVAAQKYYHLQNFLIVFEMVKFCRKFTSNRVMLLKENEYQHEVTSC